MDNHSKGKRILLDIDTVNLINEKIKELKDKSCKLNPSLFSSEIIKIFFAKYYQKEIDSIEKKFFDERAYLKTLLRDSNGSKEDLSKSIELLLKKVKSSPKKTGPNKKQVNL